MKKLLTILLLTQIHLANAELLPLLAVSHTEFQISPFTETSFDIYAKNSFFLLRRISGCGVSNYIIEPHVQIETTGTEIKVLYRKGLGGSVTCFSPWPPGYQNFTDMAALERGNYHLSLYIVPYEDAFPPTPEDLPNYFIDELTFDVLTAFNIDSSSQLSLIFLILALLVVGAVTVRKKY
jgi:hypothetical protein